MDFMDTLVIIFLPLTEAIALPFVVLSFIFGSKVERTPKAFVLFFTILSTLLVVGATVTLLIGDATSGYYVNTYNEDIDVYYHRSACVWVGMGLAIGAIVFSAVTFIVGNSIRIYQSKNRVPQSTNNQSNNIGIIKELYELYKCGAITQEEYEAKKKDLLKL